MSPVENPEGPDRKIQRSKISKYRAPKSPVRRVLHKEKQGGPWSRVRWVRYKILRVQIEKFKDPKYQNKEHPKVQSGGSSIRRNKVDPGPGSDGSGRKS